MSLVVEKRGAVGWIVFNQPAKRNAINLEEPALFNQTLESFLHQVEAGRWGARDPRSTVPSLYGPSGRL